MFKFPDYIEILNDICNYQLVIFGLSLTIFTVLYSFIMNKYEEAKRINEQLDLCIEVPMYPQKIASIQSYLLNWVRINTHIKIVSIFSFPIYVLSLLTKYFVNKNSILIQYISSFLVILSILLTIYVGYLLYSVYKDYEKTAKKLKE